MLNGAPPEPMPTVGFEKARNILDRAQSVKTAAPLGNAYGMNIPQSQALMQSKPGAPAVERNVKSLGANVIGGMGIGKLVTDFAHDVKACALGQASSSIMARHIVGSTATELRALRETVRKMLKENGPPPPDGKWAEIALLEPVRDYKARHASTLLTFDAVVDAIGQIEARSGQLAPAQS